MKFINTDGMAFIGPGSEWFWTAISGIVLAVTFIAIYRQLALQRSASAYAQVIDLDRQDDAEPMLRMKLEILRALRDGCEPKNIPYGVASGVNGFWEDVGVLFRQGHLDRRLLHDQLGLVCRHWWAIIQPWLEEVRAEQGPQVGEHFEWLAGQMAEMDRKLGDTTRYDLESILPRIDTRIRNLSDRLRIAEDLRRPLPPAVPAPQPQPPAAATTAEG